MTKQELIEAQNKGMIIELDRRVVTPRTLYNKAGGGSRDFAFNLQMERYSLPEQSLYVFTEEKVWPSPLKPFTLYKVISETEAYYVIDTAFYFNKVGKSWDTWQTIYLTPEMEKEIEA